MREYGPVAYHHLLYVADGKAVNKAQPCRRRLFEPVEEPVDEPADEPADVPTIETNIATSNTTKTVQFPNDETLDEHKRYEKFVNYLKEKDGPDAPAKKHGGLSSLFKWK